MLMSEDSELPHVPGYLTVREVADGLELSERMVHTYIQDGRLPGQKMGRMTVVKEEDYNVFRRSKKGRPRSRIPPWRRSVGENFQQMTLITTKLRPGQDDKFEQKLDEMRAKGKHVLPGTVARYIVRSDKIPDEVQIVLIWRSSVMPTDEKRKASMDALRAELAEILDWKSAWIESGKVLMHT